MTHIATDPELGVRSPRKSKIFAIVNPTNLVRTNRVSIQCNYNVYKNWPLGHGLYRISGNLGPLMQTIRTVKENGYGDVLWMLDDYVKEMNVLNVFVLWKSRFGKLELITPPDDGCIFNGITRKSIIELAAKIKKDKNVDVIERNISIHEIINAHEEHRLLEFFGGSGSATIQHVHRIAYKEKEVELTNSTPFSDYLGVELMAIMRGSSDHPWVTAFN